MSQEDQAFLAGGEMGEFMRRRDWARTPLPGRLRGRASPIMDLFSSRRGNKPPDESVLLVATTEPTISTSDKQPFSRRHIVRAGGIGLAAAATAPAFAQNSPQGAASEGREEQGLRNPADKYPQPPFQKQSQP